MLEIWPGVPMADDTEEENEGRRQIVLTKASAIRPTRVKWLWQDRLALGTIGLLAGREGVGKTTAAYWLAAVVTKGTLAGEHHEEPKSVLIAASEDSWSHTIVPRLIAAGADLDRVYRIEVITDSVHSEISLPRDLHALEQIAVDVDAALLLLDPLMSRLSDTLDTHRDAEVRRALEPLAALADKAGLAVLGLIHHNKSGSSDPLQLVMGSKAFTAVARSVHTVITDPEDETETRRLFGTPKNNLGRSDLPTLAFTISSFAIETEDGTAWTGCLTWGENSPTSISEAMRQQKVQHEDGGATSEAAEWLQHYLTGEGGSKESAKVKSAGQAAGHSEAAIKRAKLRLAIIHKHQGHPAKTWWFLPGFEKVLPVGSQSAQPVGSILRGDDLTDLSEPTRGNGSSQLSQLSQLSQNGTPREVSQLPESPGWGVCNQCGGRIARGNGLPDTCVVCRTREKTGVAT